MQHVQFQWLVSAATGRAVTAVAGVPNLRQAQVDFQDVTNSGS
jgi:hypothetical protein